MNTQSAYRVIIDFRPGEGFSVTASEITPVQSQPSVSPLATLLGAAYQAHKELARAGYSVALPGWEDWQIPYARRSDGDE